MLRFLVLAVLLPSTALAAPCGTWSANMEEGEGGRLNTASVCIGEGSQRSDLFLQCGGQDLISLRLLLPEGESIVPGDNPEFSTPLRLTVDGRDFDRPARHEAMDGAMVSEFPFSAQLLGALQAGSTAILAYPETNSKPITFPLKGSRVALDWLVKACGAQ